MTVERIPDTLASLTVPIDGLIPYGRNPRRGNVDVIAESLRHHGQYRPIVVRAKTFEVLAGNHTLAAAKELGWTQIAATFVDVNDDEAARIVLVDNRAADMGSYDDELLAGLLGDLSSTEEALAGTGYVPDDLEELLALAEEDSTGVDGEGRAPTTGEMLAIADVTFGEPTTEVHHGEVWRLGPHTLVVARVSDEHELWAPHLTPEHVFAPYPEPYLTCSTLAESTPLLLVQPNKFLAGHLIDKHTSAHPGDAVARLEPAGVLA